MLTSLIRIFSADLKRARDLLREGFGTAQEAFLSAEEIRTMRSATADPELRHIRAACIIAGASKLHAADLEKTPAPRDLSCFDGEPALADQAARALRASAQKTDDLEKRRRILACQAMIPGLKSFRVLGQLYLSESGLENQKAHESAELFVFASSMQSAIEPAREDYQAHLLRLGYRVEGEMVNDGALRMSLMV